MLEAKEAVLDVGRSVGGIGNPGQVRQVRRLGIPTHNIAGESQAGRSLANIVGGAAEGRGGAAARDLVGGSSIRVGWPGHRLAWLAKNRIRQIERIVGKVPARVREGIVEGALVGDSEPAADGVLAGAERIPGETEAR